MAKKTRRRTKGTGSIFERNGRYYYRNRKAGIGDKALGTSNYDEAVTKAKDRYGYLDYKEEEKQTEALLLRYEGTKEIVKRNRRKATSLKGSFAAYKEKLLITSEKSKLHSDASEEQPLADATLYVYELAWNQLLNSLASDHPEIISLQDISDEMAESYFIQLRKTKAPGTYNGYLAAIRTICKTLIGDYGAFSRIRPIKAQRLKNATARKQPFTLAQLKIVHKKATGWIQPASMIGYYTGLRLGSVVILKVSDITEDGFVMATNLKGIKEQIIYSPEILPHVAKWIKERSPTDTELEEYLFPEHANAYLGITRKRDRTIASKQFMRFLRKICKFKVDDENENTVLGFHSLRVSHATIANRAGSSRDEIQQRLAHSNASTTIGYIHEQLTDLKAKALRDQISLPSLSGETKDSDSPLKKAIWLLEKMDAQNWREKSIEVQRELSKLL